MTWEVWKDIIGYEWLYRVSNFGRVKSAPKYNCRYEKILEPRNAWNGYSKITLTKTVGVRKDFYIHRLVFATFSEISIPDGMQVCHINDTRKDNRYSNLFLWTAKENTADMIRKWRDTLTWERKSRRKFTIEQVEKLRRVWSFWVSQKFLWRALWVSQACVSNALLGRTYKCVQ
jgi:hypothetical protein